MSTRILAVLLLCVSLPAGAAPVLTLDDALKQAMENNLDMKVARGHLDEAHELSSQAWSGYLPHLTAGGSYTYNSVQATFALPETYLVRDGTSVYEEMQPPYNPKNPNEGLPSQYYLYPGKIASFTIQPHNQLGGQIQLTQAILAPSLWPAIQGAYLGEKAAELSTEQARREILFAAVQLYYGAAGAKQAADVEKQILDLNIAHEKDAQVRVDSGAYPRIYLVRAQIDRTRAEEDLRNAQNAYQSTISSLAALLNRAPDFDVSPPPEPVIPEGVENAGEDAIRERPDVKATVEQAKASRAGLLSSTLAYAPNVGFTGNLQGTNAPSLIGSNYLWNVGIGVSWNLFDGGLRESNIRSARARVVEAENNQLSTEVKARDELRRARLTLQTARANRIKADEQVKLARENASLVKVAFDAGGATYLEFADANLALTSAELGRVAETLNAQLAVIQLAKAAGAFNPQ